MKTKMTMEECIAELEKFPWWSGFLNDVNFMGPTYDEWKAKLFQMVKAHPANQPGAEPTTEPILDDDVLRPKYDRGETVAEVFEWCEAAFNQGGW